MLKLFFIFFVSCNLLCACVGQIVQNGQCDPDIPLLENFELEQFAGTWFEIQRSDSPEQNADCAYFEFTLSDSTINVHHSGVNNNFQEESEGIAVTTNGSPRLTLDLPMFDGHERARSSHGIVNMGGEAMEFWVLLSDYRNYSLTYSCENISSNQRSLHIWVLGRERVIGNSLVIAHINTTLNNLFGITLSDLTSIDHSDVACYVLPDIEPGEAIVLPGQCNNTIPVQQNFNATAFTGTWHQISSYYSNNSNGNCNRAQYSIGDEVVEVLNSEVINQTLFTISGTAVLIGEDGSAKLNVTLNVGSEQVSSELWVISTDYTSYAISYSCEDLGNDEKRIYSWILSRTRVLNTTAETQVNEVINSIVELNNNYYLPTDHSPEACFFFPDPSDQPVVFRGQCDTDIPAMPDFDPQRYTGFWHNIELYPTFFQDGTCSNAYYDLNGAIVSVFNTQVKNETLDTINGIAVIVADDGSAKLEVSFPIAGTDLTTTSNYWVLDTNYTSYALVYSCSNLDDDNMQVSSWKLSRSRTLTTEDNDAIDRAMNITKVLDQSYFKVENQTAEGCFFVPTPEVGKPVVFPGQCDLDFSMADFNLTEFEGTWYEIQSYPKEQEQGQCISYTYSFVSNSELELTTSSVYDQFRNVVNATVTSSDGTGRLTITIKTDNETTIDPIPFWIVATNYTDYALAYACINRGDYYKAVWSWKLSRTPQLSLEADNAINEAISDIEILDNIYYEDIQHTEEACFYLPDIEPGEPIILDGQCNNNITAITNFNLTRFAGPWKLIQSYHTDFQSGTCNEVRFTQIDELTVSVIHTQVSDQILESISATASIANSNGTGLLQFSFPNSTQTFDYIILDTDYDDYAIAYGCENIGTTQRQVWSWKLSRGNTLTDDAIDNITQIINGIDVLNNRYYYNVDRTETDCFYFPEVTDDSSFVVFRARCNQSIAAQADFQPSNYTGLWHDIQSYPQLFQDGTCANAKYTLNDGQVDVLNTQVINQRLDTIWGKAVLASDDGSAKLDVTFDIGGIQVNASYWVLSTDYDTYAFVYSCRDIDDEYIQVSSWKLSRNKILSDTANNTINEIMSTIPVLDDRYFRTTDQSEAGCFYFPEPQPNVPVVFPGQCDDTINTVQNFNFSLFEGTWHEIQAYPKEFQPGQCVNHEYSLTNESRFDLVSSSVFGQTLTLTYSEVTGSDGKLNITISGGETIPFWIIATNYSDYALAYSCVNRGDDTRSVYSWKLSRTRELSLEAVSAIDDAMADIDVVDNIYFEVINQTDEACFYYPEVVPGEPVIFRGQCDTAIRGIANFTLSQFTDRWRLVQGYPTDSPRGTCIESNYNQIDNQTITATYTQVLDQNLRSISGVAIFNSSDGTGILQYTFPDSTEPIEYIILDTDYVSYALVYSCENINDEQRRVTSWKLSRNKTLSDEANIRINQTINGIDVLDARYYSDVDHTEAGCFYFPEVNDNSSFVVFRARCNESIPAQSGFEPDRYTGLWHDIQSYPQLFQDGTCANANYTLTGGQVDVLNTQVINQRLDTIWGKAVLASDDGSAKLDVTFDIGGIQVNASYWVLSTDYDSYAFVYSCRDIDDEYIQVSSWKLSRNKTLSDTANSTINEIMTTIPVLDDRYFRTVDQSESGCFYFPDPEPNVPVVFPGQCDDTINTVQNFNFSRFEGTWHEIEAYPKDFQPGQCVNHEYSLINESRFDLVSSSVLNQTLSLTYSEVTGNDGKLSISISAGVSIPFWIIDTDFTDYALAYSCVNQGDDFRSVYSWKLSRNRTLSADGYDAINDAMRDIDVIDNMYFETIQQTDEACFYLPDLGPNEPVTFRGQCDPNITVISNFNATRYLGRWRLIETYYSDFQSGSCIDATYLAGEDSVLVVNTQVVNQQLETETGSAVLATADGSGKLLVTFPSSPVVAEYWILDTDYESYTLVYSCTNIEDDRRRVSSWKMSRTTNLTDDANAAINNVTSSINVLDDRYYQLVNHTDEGCFYYPEPDVNKPVIFRARCNENIPAQSGFEPDRYTGLWHDIQSYPQLFQDGTCANANYTLTGGQVDVLNTQVINQRLDTIWGKAVLASDDGSAKLDVTFDIGGIQVNASYWVLSTDYDTYAFVYSCRDIDDEYIQVSSWKLSRNKTLSDTANNTINEIMTTIPVLDDRYFRTVDQSESGCFYFPDPEPNVPVVFPGQCDDTINTVQNFNFSRFEGTWHEIEAYPKDFQPGQCVNHEYSLINESRFDLVSSSVLNQTLSLTYSEVTGNDGKLSISISAGVSIPFWIIDTDYTDYALAYSCVNQGDDFRSVYSWKLSRNRTLSADGYDAINDAMRDIDVIDNMYFETIQQTDEACFYLPDLGPNEPVTFRGQCDPNITVISNFNATRYLGRWRLIETYYSDFQSGSCIDATYLAGEDSVLVVNTQVVNQQLETETGSAVLATADGSGKLLVTFPSSPVVAEYWILDTDYESYTLVYSCTNIEDDRRRVSSWKMSRTTNLTDDANAAINNVTSSINVLDDRYYQLVNHTDEGCFYYPEPDVNKPVIFRGQCNMTIPAYPGFEPDKYLGFWYDIESYPAPFQTGTCQNANYTLADDGTIHVRNTQVVNQVLEIWIGSAVIDSDDGSAKLNVTFNINGMDVTSKYWVLDTDYDSFALVYSCTNIDAETRSVSSWKLSKTPTLTANASNAIDAVINSIPVLNQTYYIERNHSAEACFYYPDNNGGDVILPGQCPTDDEVLAVTNFTANAFMGTWYEVSRFPSDLQRGECASTQYALSGSSAFTVTQVFVYNEREESRTAQVTLSDSNRGVFSVDIDGDHFDTVYILGTNYNEYALAYSCRNIDDKNQKQIYSWKLSRSRSGLSDTANSAIDEIVKNNDDLWEPYYRPTAQDNDACFYYPVFDTLPASIELPGPCPSNIRGVNNFRIASYLGKWYETARYPSRMQQGQCSRAEYDGVDRVAFRNTAVIDQILITQTGYADHLSEEIRGEFVVENEIDGEIVKSNYYVLATDYYTFSLVYSCADLRNGNRQVSSWKLSRTKNLPASPAMDAAIANTQGLTQEFYLPTSQSDDDCFYIPSVIENQAPRFRGQCEDIIGVEGFDAERYLGWWHEIERYTVDGWFSGECRSSEYSQDGNTYRVVDTRVTANQGFILNGTVTVTNDGRLRRTINGNIEDIWVLATDYETYALLYSCENVDDEYRRVWSAKHSKTRSLTEAAQNAMAPFIENNKVLYPQFYRYVDQRDEVCFHYPEVTDGQVIIPGQCDTNIPVKWDFDIAAFAGTWYYTERYDAVGDSSCAGIRFILNENDGSLKVIEFEVLDEELQTLEGTATVASSDSTARLNLTFPVPDSEDDDATITTNVLILDIDYTNFAVMYTCSNVNPYQRQVRAWKLSRERSLQEVSNATINELINRRPELHQPYFNVIEQREDCPEPSSALIVKSSIIMLLICALLQRLL